MAEHDFKWRWSHVDQSDHTAAYVEMLNRLRGDDDPINYPNTLTWINPQAGERVLEVGCGNGAVARAVARQMPTLRELVAVDASATLIAEAQRQLRGRALPVTFAIADAHDLPFADASFDRCYAMEVFVILPDPYQALQEMMRVTRPGGCVCIWENDCDSQAMLGTDLALTRRLTRFFGDHEYNGAVARQIIGWFKDAEWQISIVPTLNISEDDSWLRKTLLPEWLEDARQAGIATTEEIAQFLADMQQRQQRGAYFSYLANFRILAMKPMPSLTKRDDDGSAVAPK